MKRALLAVATAMFIFSSSCVKDLVPEVKTEDYTCTCVGESIQDGKVTASSSASAKLTALSRAEAEKDCQSGNRIDTLGTNAYLKTTCTLQ